MPSPARRPSPPTRSLLEDGSPSAALSPSLGVLAGPSAPARRHRLSFFRFFRQPQPQMAHGRADPTGRTRPELDSKPLDSKRVQAALLTAVEDSDSDGPRDRDSLGADAGGGLLYAGVRGLQPLGLGRELDLGNASVSDEAAPFSSPDRMDDVDPECSPGRQIRRSFRRTRRPRVSDGP